MRAALHAAKINKICFLSLIFGVTYTPCTRIRHTKEDIYEAEGLLLYIVYTGLIKYYAEYTLQLKHDEARAGVAAV